MGNSSSIIAYADCLCKQDAEIEKQLREIMAYYRTCIPFSLSEIKSCKDIWARDFMPVMRHDGKYVQYRYRPDYLIKKRLQRYMTDSRNAKIVMNDHSEGKTLNELFDIVETDLVFDGGNVIICKDKKGKNCVLMTAKVLYENPKKRHLEVLSELERVFDAEVILLPWDKLEEYGHADGMVRYVRPGVLLLNNYQECDEELYHQLELALSNRFELLSLSYGKYIHLDSWCHINFIELDHLMLVSALAIPSDALAKEQIERIYGKEVRLIKARGVVEAGGALHCISWNI